MKSRQTGRLSISQVCQDMNSGEMAVRRQAETGGAGATVSRPASP